MFSKRAGFSLSSQNENRVLTFSSKINSNGDLVDCVVRPGIGRNFLILSYDEVDLALTGKIAPRSYPFGIPPPPPTKPQLFERHMNDLRTLTMIQHRVMKNRVAQGIIEPNAEAPNFKRFVPAENIESPIMRSSEFRGFPQFDYYVADMTTSAATARGLVAESMRLACRTASRWCTERGVDVIRRIGSPLVVTPTAEEQLLSMRDENGFVDIAHITALATSLPTAENSLTPGAHWGMGIREGEGYTRATSPLRRFADLIGHYQIHRALLGEKPYFSRTYLEDHLKWLKHDDQLKKRTETLHQRFWVLMALRRWLEAPRTDIPDPLSNLEAIIMRQVRFNTVTNSFQAEVRIPRLGISGFLENISLRRRGDWVISRTIPVKFQDLLLGVRPRLVLSEPNKKPDSLI
jgi:hypothetical protein